jgi:hypothetical protein
MNWKGMEKDWKMAQASYLFERVVERDVDVGEGEGMFHHKMEKAPFS